MGKEELVVLNETNKKPCQFCGIDDLDQINYGPLYMVEDVVAHYYCVLLSHKMRQRGKDEQGIMGFLLTDVRAEIKRGSKIKCTYCGKYYATLQCSHPRCKQKFHLPCGLKEGSMHQFEKQFLSFCCEHRPKQDIPQKVLSEAECHNPICSICYELVDYKSETQTLWAPCCSKTWYHRICVQQLANSAGYFFKCAICNNSDKFRNCMLKFGIFIPEQDASWELEPDAFQDLYIRHNNCDAEECKCSNGRNHNVDDTRWEIILCRSCGSQGIHVACGRLKYSDPTWECANCKKVPGVQVDSLTSASPPASSVSSISSSSSDSFRIGNRRKKNRSKSLEGKANTVKRRSEAAPSSLPEEPSVATRSTFSRSDPKRRSEPVSKRKRKVNETNEEEEKVKHHRRKKRRSVRDENSKPVTDADVEAVNKFETKPKDGVECSSSKSAESENSKESSELEKEDNPKDEKIDKKSSNDFSEVYTGIRPGPLRFKLAALKRAVGDETLVEGSTEDDDDIMILPRPVKKTLIIDLSDSDEKTESDVQIEETEKETCKKIEESEVRIQPENLKYRVKKEFIEIESDEEVLIAEPSEADKRDSSDSEVSKLPPDPEVIKDLYGSNAKIVGFNAGLTIVKTEVEEVEPVPEERNKEKEIEKAVEQIVLEMARSTPEPRKSSKAAVKPSGESEAKKTEEKMKPVEKVPEAKEPESKSEPVEEKKPKPEMIGSLKPIQQPPNEKWVLFEGRIYAVKETEKGILLEKVTETDASASQSATTVSGSQPAQIVTSSQSAPIVTRSQPPQPVISSTTAPQKSPLPLSAQLAVLSSPLPPSTNTLPVSTAPSCNPLRYSTTAPASYQSPVRPTQSVPYTPPRHNPPSYQYSYPRASSGQTTPMNYNPTYSNQSNRVPTTGYVQFPAPRSTRPPTSTYVPPHSSSMTYSSPSRYVPSTPVPQPPTSGYSQIPVSSYASVPPSQQQPPSYPPQASPNYMNIPRTQPPNYVQTSSAYVPTSSNTSLPSFPEFQVVGALKPITTQEYVLAPSVPPTTTATFRSQQYSASSSYSAAYSTPQASENYPEATPYNFNPKIVETCSLPKDKFYDASDFSSSPRKPGNVRQVTPVKRHPRKQSTPQMRGPISPVRMPHPKPVATIPPTQTPKNPQPKKVNNDNDDIMIIDEKKPPIPALRPVPELLNRPKGPSKPPKKIDYDKDVIELD